MIETKIKIDYSDELDEQVVDRVRNLSSPAQLARRKI